MRIPRHTSASHILLYSRAFLIKVDLRRRCFSRIGLLLEIGRFDLGFEPVGDRVAAISNDAPNYSVITDGFLLLLLLLIF